MGSKRKPEDDDQESLLDQNKLQILESSFNKVEGEDLQSTLTYSLKALHELAEKTETASLEEKNTQVTSNNLGQAGVSKKIFFPTVNQENDRLSDTMFDSDLDRATATYSLAALSELAGKTQGLSEKTAAEKETPTVFNKEENATVSEIQTTKNADLKEKDSPKKVNRYEIIKLLGEGGMGKVYQAYDITLKRNVALKFIKGDNPKFVERLMREGRAQAKIDHPNVCKVYEVGQSEGRFFISMQYLPGITLKEIAKEMSLEQKIKIIIQVSEALHAAHKEGLIHRDIKPGNIIVERGELGYLPYVMDFGLAREVEQNDGLSVVGVVLGTPAYMAPEQAAQAFGEKVELDRRADIYSLGTTFYELLAGKLPFAEGTTLEMLARVAEVEPTPLSKINPRIPTDLEAIVMKCLEKEPKQRYDSARLLAEDLQNYLNGDPVQAKRSSLVYRLTKKAKKNKAVVAVSLAALIGLGTLGGLFTYTRWTKNEQARLAQIFGQEVEKIAAISRYAYMLPLHNSSQEKILVKSKIEKIKEQMNSLGKVGIGPGNYALGKGYYALQNYKQAYHHLNLAWQTGYQVPEVSYNLGLVLGTLYLESLKELNRITDPEILKKRKEEIEKKYRQEALKYLKNSNLLETDSPEYVEGLIAFYENRYQDSLQKAQNAFQKLPWLYEAKKLEADIFLQIGRNKQDKGEYDNAREDFNKADQAYKAAIEIAHSDSTIYENHCELMTQLMEMTIEEGKSPEAIYQEALSIADKAIKSDTQNSLAYLAKSNLYWKWGDYQIANGQDPSEVLATSVEVAKQALKINPKMAEAYTSIGLALETKAEYELYNGKNPTESLKESIESYQKSIEIDPNLSGTYNSLGIAYEVKSMYEASEGTDPRPSLEKAVMTFQKAIELDQLYASSYINLGNTFAKRSDYEAKKGQDPRPSIELAIETYKKGIEINPKIIVGHMGLGNAYGRQGSYEINIGIDPRPAFRKALEYYLKALELNPQYAQLHLNAGLTQLLMADYEIAVDLDPRQVLKDAIDSSEKAIKINANLSYAYRNIATACFSKINYFLEKKIAKESQGEINSDLLKASQALEMANKIDPDAYKLEVAQLEFLKGKVASAQNQNPNKFFQQAELIAKSMMETNSENPDLYLTMAKIAYEQAKYNGAKTSSKNIEQGLNLIEKALLINLKLAEGFFLKSELLNLQAEVEEDTERKSNLSQQAKVAMEEAKKINPLLGKK